MTPPYGFSLFQPQLSVHSQQRGDVWVFPGIGSRFVGMGADILGSSAAADRLVEMAGQWLGYDVVAVCLEGSGRKYVSPRTETQVLYVIDCAYAETLRECGLEPSIVCGHSMGTYAAAYTAGVYDFLTGLSMVSTVENLLERHIVPATQGMGVVLGLPLERLETITQRQEGVFLANFNSPGQYVVAGKHPAVARVMEKAMEAGAFRTKWLGSQRAFHTPLLEAVSADLGKSLANYQLRRPSVTLVGSSDGQFLRSRAAIRKHLERFLCLPVRWEETIRRLVGAGASRAFLEVGPGTVLTDLMGYIDRDVLVQTASDLLREVVTT